MENYTEAQLIRLFTEWLADNVQGGINYCSNIRIQELQGERQFMFRHENPKGSEHKVDYEGTRNYGVKWFLEQLEPSRF